MTAHFQGDKPHEKMPEHLSTNKKAETKEEKIDAQMADSFPASDPPSFSGGVAATVSCWLVVTTVDGAHRLFTPLAASVGAYNSAASLRNSSSRL